MGCGRENDGSVLKWCLFGWLWFGVFMMCLFDCCIWNFGDVVLFDLVVWIRCIVVIILEINVFSFNFFILDKSKGFLDIIEVLLVILVNVLVGLVI